MPVSPALVGQPAPTDRWRAAGVAAVVGAVAAGMRFAGLGRPAEVVFDETYYAKDAWALLRTGAERKWLDGANDQILDGDLSGLTDEPSFASHPPMGKWVIAAGEWVAGLTPLGWRLGVAVLGTLAAVVMVYLARRVTRSTALGGLAGLLVALDGLAIVTSRIAVLDGMLMFWVVLAAALLVRDRDSARSRMATGLGRRTQTPQPERVLAEGAEAAETIAVARGSDAGDATAVAAVPHSTQMGDASIPLWRPWRLLMGVALGLATATKWSGLPVLAAFGVLTVVWQAGALAQAGGRHPVRRALLIDAPAAFVTVVGAALAAYLATWSGWLRGSDGYERQWAAANPASGSLADLVPDALRSLWHYHATQYDLLSQLDAEHNWQSSPGGWLILLRPVLFYRDKPGMGEDGCTATECVGDILAVGTPLTWWVGVAALLLVGWRAAARADWRAWLIVAGVAATWLPWFAYADRPIFSSYAIVTLPFVVLAIVLALRVLPDGLNAAGPAVARRWRRSMVAVGVVLLALTVAQVWFFWPVWTGEPIPLDEWRLRIWLPGWS